MNRFTKRKVYLTPQVELALPKAGMLMYEVIGVSSTNVDEYDSKKRSENPEQTDKTDYGNLW